MVKKNIKSALNASLQAEDEAVKSRFERAEALLDTQSQSTNRLAARSQSEPEPPQEPINSQQVIRDSFTLPHDDYELIDLIKKRCLQLAVNVNKSEVIRAGLHALQKLPEPEFLNVINDLAKVKTGRPPKNSK